MSNFQKKGLMAKPAPAPAPVASAPVAHAPEMLVSAPQATATAPAALATAPELSAFEAPIAAAKAAIAATTANAEQVASQINSQTAVVKENMRKATEDSVTQGRAAYDRVKTAAEDATGSLESSYATAAKGLTDLNAHVFSAMRANGEAMFDLVKALSSVKSMDEIVSVQTAHVRQQVETLTTQTKELAALAQKVAADAAAPIKASFGKTFAAH